MTFDPESFQAGWLACRQRAAEHACEYCWYAASNRENDVGATYTPVDSVSWRHRWRRQKGDNVQGGTVACRAYNIWQIQPPDLAPVQRDAGGDRDGAGGAERGQR